MLRGVAVGLLVVAVGWAALGNSTVTFRDGAWNVVGEYMIGERLDRAQKVWIQVDDPNLAAGDAPWVELYNPATRDRVNHQLTVAPAFLQRRSLNPVLLVPATGSPSVTDQRLEVRPGDTIHVYYTDPSNPGDTSQATARAVWGEVQLYEGEATLPNLRGTFRGAGAINAALARADAVVPPPPQTPALRIMAAPRIVVQPGTYREDININPGAAWVGGLVLEAAAAGVRLVNRTPGTAAVRIEADGVTVRGFEIYPTGAGSHGIHVVGNRSGIRIERNAIVNPAGSGIFADGPLSSSHIVGNTIRGGIDGPAHGIQLRQDVTAVVIADNLIESCRGHGIWFENHLGNRPLQNVQIVGNTIRNNWGSRPAHAGAGIRFGAAALQTLTNLRIAGNVIYGNEHGIEILFNGAAGHLFRDITIAGNVIFGHRDPIGGAPVKAGLRVAALATTVLPANFTVTGNEFRGNEVGILLAGGILPTDVDDVRPVNILGNRISRNRVGVQVFHPSNTIRDNDIVENEQWGVHAQGIRGTPMDRVDARNNWWGHATGPRHFTRNPRGLGNAVTDHVLFEPYKGAGVVAMIDIRDAMILPTGTGTVEIWFTGANLADLRVGPVSALTFSDAAKVEVAATGAVVGVAPYQVLAYSYTEAGGVGTLTFAVILTPGASPRAGPIARITVRGTGVAGDTVRMTLGPVPVDQCLDGGGATILHTVDDGILTLSPAAPPAQLRGDVNDSRTVDITDARWAAEAAIGVRTLTAAQFAAADVAPPSGTVDITDARWIAEAAVGLRTLALPLPSSPLTGGTAVVKWDAGVLQIAGVQASDVQGRILYNPASVSITGLSGLNGFEVLAWRDDPLRGEVRFAAYRLHGGAAGPVLQVQARGDTGTLSIVLDVLRGPDGTDIPYGTAATPMLLSVGNAPNPVTDVNTTRFHVKATVPVVEIRVSLYDLAGRLVWDSGWGLNGLAWHLSDLRGHTVANGVYLYQVQVRLEGLAGTVTSGLLKLAVYR